MLSRARQWNCYGDSATASDHLPVKVVFRNPFAQPFRITSMVRSNETLALAWESVPGQSYAVEGAAQVVTSNVWTTLAENIVATNYAPVWQTNLTMPAAFLRVTHP